MTELPLDKPTVVFFKGQGCATCSLLLPIFQKVIKAYQPKIIAQFVDISKDAPYAISYGVLSVPTLIFFKNGKEVNRLTGLVSEDKIIKALASLETINSPN